MFTLEMKNSPLKNATRAIVFGGTQFICITFRVGMSMWSIFDQFESYTKKSEDHEPIEMLHGAAGRFGNRARAIFYSTFSFLPTGIEHEESRQTN